MAFNYHKYISLPFVSNSRKKRVKKFYKDWKPQLASVQYDANCKILGTSLLTLKETVYVAPEIIRYFYCGLRETFCLNLEEEKVGSCLLFPVHFLDTLLKEKEGVDHCFHYYNAERLLNNEDIL